MLQNRVDPWGALHAVPDRGAWFGNRGCLHDDHGRIVRTHRGRRWITCLCAFRGRRRALLRPGRYTELFFADEATAYAAGHRPCAECRRADWMMFRDLWGRVIGGATDADSIDRVLHAARMDGAQRRTLMLRSDEVPDGVVGVPEPGKAIVRAHRAWWAWGFAGHEPIDAIHGDVAVLTPWPIVRLMQAGLPVQTACRVAYEKPV